MKETTIKSAKTAVTITTVLTFFAAGFEAFMAFMGSKPGMNVFDIASFATANPNVYCLILILVNIILLPSAILLYRQNEISLKKENRGEENARKGHRFRICGIGGVSHGEPWLCLYFCRRQNGACLCRHRHVRRHDRYENHCARFRQQHLQEDLFQGFCKAVSRERLSEKRKRCCCLICCSPCSIQTVQKLILRTLR